MRLPGSLPDPPQSALYQSVALFFRMPVSSIANLIDMKRQISIRGQWSGLQHRIRGTEVGEGRKPLLSH